MFEYNEGTLKMNQIRISPSGVNELLNNFSYWFKSRVLKQSYEYGKPDNRVLGTVLHALIENYYTKEHTQEEVLEKAGEYITNSGVVDSWKLIENVDTMFEAWKEQFAKEHEEPSKVEGWVEFEPSNRIKLSGTYDALFGDTLFDWKSTATKKSTFGNYKAQLYTYAWLLRKNDIEVNNIGICYIQQPLKSGQVNIIVLKEPIDEDYMRSLIGKIKTASDKVIEAMDNEVIRDFLANIDEKSPYDRSSI